MYTTEELMKASRKIFGCNGSLVAAALKSSGKTEFTLEEAQKIVAEYASEKVKK